MTRLIPSLPTACQSTQRWLSVAVRHDTPLVPEKAAIHWSSCNKTKRTSMQALYMALLYNFQEQQSPDTPNTHPAAPQAIDWVGQPCSLTILSLKASLISTGDHFRHCPLLFEHPLLAWNQQPDERSLPPSREVHRSPCLIHQAREVVDASE